MAAASTLVASASITTEIPDSASPIASASPGWTRPDGTGRPLVRRMMASISASHHMFSAPEAPPPKAMKRMAENASTGCRCTGATISPTRAVNTTSDITRGFKSCT